MARLSLSLVLLSILSSSLVSATPQIYDEAAQAEQHKDASCDVSAQLPSHHRGM
jgi:hypothetical protein